MNKCPNGKGLFKKHKWNTTIFEGLVKQSGRYTYPERIYPKQGGDEYTHVRLCVNCGDCQGRDLFDRWYRITFAEYTTLLKSAKNQRLEYDSRQKLRQKELEISRTEALGSIGSEE